VNAEACLAEPQGCKTVQDRRLETADGRSGGRPNAWQCPSCGRQVPRHVEVCRCGSERRRLEALGYKFESAPAPAVRPVVTQRPPQDYGLAGTLFGYQLDTDLGTGWRVALKAIFGIAVTGVVAALVHFTHGEPLPVRDNIQILNTLDGFTRNAGPESGNTIPMFAASPGRLGVLSESGTPADPVRSMDPSDLQQGFCSQSIVKQVRYEYPGYYDHWPNDKLERMVLQKHPEYADRVCMLSVRLDAAANEVIKYDLRPRSVLGHAALWLRTLLITAVFAAGCLNVYYRLIVGRLVPPTSIVGL
jgi:hypothetical protein